MATLLTVDDGTSRQSHNHRGHGTSYQRLKSQSQTENNAPESELSDGEDDFDSSAARWLEHSLIKPLRALQELPSYPNLLCLLKILITVAVTSCSAERVMSRV